MARRGASGNPRLSHLFLIRHGESAWNAEGRLQGQADPELSEAGRAQAAALAPLVAALPADHVLTSDLRRSRDTAVLAGRPDAPLDAAWRERGLGAWETHLESEVATKEEMAAFRRGDLVPPGGESWPEFGARVAGALEAVAARGGSWLVFTHGGCVRAAVAHVVGGDAMAVAGPANASLTVFRLSRRRRLVLFNWTPEHAGLGAATDPGGAR